MKSRNKSSHCPNCGFALGEQSNFCPECGQENDNKRQSFSKVMLELIQGFLSIDSRLAHSLPALLFRPGFLTKEYLNGRRQRYLDPVRMFITIVVIYFIVASFLDDKNINENNNNAANSEIQNPDSALSKNNTNLKFGVTEIDKPVNDEVVNYNNRVNLGVPHYQKIKEMVKVGITNTDVILDSLKIEPTFWNRFWYGEIIKFASSNMEQFNEFLYAKLPWIIFFLMPVFALLLKLIYIRRDFLYIDHLIFAFHLHSFLFICGIIYELISKVSVIAFPGLITLAIFIYVLLAFKNFYRQSKRKTILKILVLTFLYSICAIICFTLAMVFIFLIY